jgi:hypothetical protein
VSFHIKGDKLMDNLIRKAAEIKVGLDKKAKEFSKPIRPYLTIIQVTAALLTLSNQVRALKSPPTIVPQLNTIQKEIILKLPEQPFDK